MAIDTSQPHVQFLFVYNLIGDEFDMLQTKLAAGCTWHVASSHISLFKKHAYFVSLSTATELTTRGAFLLLYGMATSCLFETLIDVAKCRMWYRVGPNADMKLPWIECNTNLHLAPFTDFASLFPST
jgi:hypothetical protein